MTANNNNGSIFRASERARQHRLPERQTMTRRRSDAAGRRPFVLAFRSSPQESEWQVRQRNGSQSYFQDLSRCKQCSIEFPQYRQRSNKSWAPGLVKFAPGLSYLSCLSLAWVPLIYVWYNCKPFCASLYNLRQLLKVRLEGVKDVNKWLEKYPPSS